MTGAVEHLGIIVYKEIYSTQVTAFQVSKLEYTSFYFFPIAVFIVVVKV